MRGPAYIGWISVQSLDVRTRGGLAVRGGIFAVRPPSPRRRPARRKGRVKRRNFGFVSPTRPTPGDGSLRDSFDGEGSSLAVCHFGYLYPAWPASPLRHGFPRSSVRRWKSPVTVASGDEPPRAFRGPISAQGASAKGRGVTGCLSSAMEPWPAPRGVRSVVSTACDEGFPGPASLTPLFISPSRPPRHQNPVIEVEDDRCIVRGLFVLVRKGVTGVVFRGDSA